LCFKEGAFFGLPIVDCESCPGPGNLAIKDLTEHNLFLAASKEWQGRTQQLFNVSGIVCLDDSLPLW
jgi:hypothetical protein